jgi:lipopolysaccharide export system permease protein
MATFFISIFVLLMQFLWKHIDDLVGKGLEWTVILQLLFYVSASLVPLALPLSILLSSLMTFGNLGEHYELVAFKSAGISLKRILRPLAFVILLLSVMAFGFSNYWLPIANLKSKSLLYDVKEQKPTMDIRPGIFSNELEGLSIRVRDKKVIDDVEHLYDILIYDHSKGEGNLSVITAEEGVMTITPDKRFLELRLYNGESYEEDKNGKRKGDYPLSRSKFRENLIREDLSQFELNRTDEELFKTNYRMLNLEQLDESIDTLSTLRNEYFKAFKDGLRKNYFFYTTVNEKVFKQEAVRQAVDFDEFVAHLSKREKEQVYLTAINLARNSKSRLSSMVNDLYGRDKYINLHLIQWHKKLTLPFACIILFLIGAPLGAIIRKGGLGMPIVISVVFFLLFHILSTTGEKMAKEGSVTAIEGMWLASLVLLPVGIFFTLKATSDSNLFKADIYRDFFKKLFASSKKKEQL